MLENLHTATGGDIKLAEKVILVIDELGKLAEKGKRSENHVSRLDVQRDLLKLLDETDFYLKDNKQFNTFKLKMIERIERFFCIILVFSYVL